MKHDKNPLEKAVYSVQKWDVLSKVALVVYIGATSVLLWLNIIGYKTAFYVGLTMIVSMGVVWWYWAYTLVKSLVRKLTDTKKRLEEVRKEVERLKNEVKDHRHD